MSKFRLPENAEASLCGCLLLCPDTRKTAASLISADDFSSPFYGALFSMAIMEDGALGAVEVQTNMKSRGFEIPDGFFRELGDIAIVPANVELYAKLLREESMRRRLLDLADTIREDKTTPPHDLISNIDAELRKIESTEINSGIFDMKAAINAFYDHRERIDSGNGAVSTGITGLDGMFSGGLLRSCVYVLAARPAMGKSTVALEIARNAARDGGVLFVSLEMSKEQLIGKLNSMISGIPANKALLEEITSQDEYNRLVSANMELERLHLYICGSDTATVSAIRYKARSVPNLRLICIDYFGLMENTGKATSRYEQMTAISRDIKKLAAKLDVPVLLLAQLNRENTGRADKRPQLSDLRDTGALEQDADAVCMLHRERYYESDGKALGVGDGEPLEILIKKNRFGSVGKVEVAFYPATGNILPM